ncbi:MAG: hypothetical protein WAU88_03135 [Candidatus Zixiibacteriota bacterium]
MTFFEGETNQSNFVIGFSKTSLSDFGVYAKGYTRAADRLAIALIEAPRFSDYEAYPVCFLYRHALELSLKQIVSDSTRLATFTFKEEVYSVLQSCHNLEKLAETVERLLVKYFPNDVDLHEFADRIRISCKEISALDQRSESFRYPVNKRGIATVDHHQIINLEAFARHLSSLLEELEVVHLGLDIETFKAEEIYAIIHSVLGTESRQDLE